MFNQPQPQPQYMFNQPQPQPQYSSQQQINDFLALKSNIPAEKKLEALAWAQAQPIRTATRKSIFTVMVKHGLEHPGGCAAPTLEDLQRETGCNPKTIRKQRKILESQGYINRAKIKAGRTAMIPVYEVPMLHEYITDIKSVDECWAELEKSLEGVVPDNQKQNMINRGIDPKAEVERTKREIQKAHFLKEEWSVLIKVLVEMKKRGEKLYLYPANFIKKYRSGEYKENTQSAWNKKAQEKSKDSPIPPTLSMLNCA